ncbi:MAG: hypothetical protein HQM08_26590 [Candidatus Riflebacteria bacterium]|nr:hypothetical protein [Candidatus Riflebacteria bacterium]
MFELSNNNAPLRLMIYDRTCRAKTFFPGLSFIWKAGAWLYRSLGGIDYYFGASDWPEALDWLLAISHGRKIIQIQYWGHGEWGLAKINKEKMDISSLKTEHPLNSRLKKLRERVIPGKTLWWFRTCLTFGGEAGMKFSKGWAEFFNCKVAGHTYKIHFRQSGLYCLNPGQIPNWNTKEGFFWSKDGKMEGLESSICANHTILCLNNKFPENW